MARTLSGIGNPTIATDTGSSSTDQITSDNSLTFTGTTTSASSGNGSATIYVYGSNDGGATWTLFGSQTVNFTNAAPSPSYSITTSTISDATNWTFIVSDQATSSPSLATTGIHSTVTSNYTIDTVAPTVSSITVAGDDVVSLGEEASFTVTGAVSTGGSSGTVSVEIFNGATSLGTFSGTFSGGTFTANVTGLTLPDAGVYTVSVTATDLAGNVGATHTEAFDSTACFMPGTMIAVPGGEAAVETLKVGDLVTTTDGKTMPVRWIGRQTVSLIFADKLRTVPIRVMAGALDENVPSRDLLVSPDHALLVDGVLVHAGALVNGSSIVRETDAPQVFTYYHVELADHSLILAENTPAETFIDNVDRMAFDNWAEHQALGTETEPTVEMTLPRAKAHRQVPSATRRRLSSRAAMLAAGKLAAAG